MQFFKCLAIIALLICSLAMNAQQPKAIKSFKLVETGAAWADTASYGFYGFINVDSWKPFTDVKVEIVSECRDTTVAPDSAGMFGYWCDGKTTLTVIKNTVRYNVSPGLNIMPKGPNLIQIELEPKY